MLFARTKQGGEVDWREESGVADTKDESSKVSMTEDKN